MPDLAILSLRGGMNDFDPPMSLDDDQCVRAENVEFNTSMLGERRRVLVPVDIAGSDLEDHDKITFVGRHLPTTDLADAELWALGVTGTSGSSLCRRSTAWATVSVSDAITLTGQYAFQMQAVSLHGKYFLAYKSAQNRLHVWDGTSLRRVGFDTPAAPTGANTGSGSFATKRYYRVRYTEQAAGVTLRRSEPSEVFEITPSGTGSGVEVAKPAALSEGETHWELEASLDNANFYVIATTVVGTTTYVDSTAAGTGYGAFELSEEIGEYTPFPSVRYLVADEDRLIGAGSFEEDDAASAVIWSPVYNAPGNGNDERVPTATDNTLNLDGFEGGRITGMSSPVSGYIFVFKQSHIYKLVRTGQRAGAYEAVRISDKRGALEGSVVEGVDQNGQPALYFLNPNVGPSITGLNGLQRCGGDVRTTWASVNIDATSVVTRAVFDPENEQVLWWVATDGSNVPNLVLVLHTDAMRLGEDGYRRGFAVWTGNVAGALSACLFSSNIDAGTDRNVSLKPFVGVTGGNLLYQIGAGVDDDGTAFDPLIKTKPYMPAGIIDKWGVRSGSMVRGTATADASVQVTAVRDFGLETLVVPDPVDFTPEGSETHVIRQIDDLSFSELRAVHFEFEDGEATPTASWAIQRFAVKLTGEQTGAGGGNRR